MEKANAIAITMSRKTGFFATVLMQAIVSIKIGFEFLHPRVVLSFLYGVFINLSLLLII